MKPTILLLLTLGCAQASPDFLNLLRQKQQDSGLVWDVPVEPLGKSPSALKLEPGGALFQLWTIHKQSGRDFLLDQKLVGAFLPQATVTVRTGDPYTHVPRTRADQPFTVEIHVSGILSGPDVPEAAARVRIEHHARTPEQPAGDLTNSAPQEPIAVGYLEANGITSLEFPVTNLAAEDPTKATGEEHFTIHALADGEFGESQIASGFVQIWPVASGHIAGIADGNVVRFKTPVLDVTMEDLYPRSDSYVQVYPGPAKLGTEGKRLEGSFLVLDQDRPASRMLRVFNYGELFEQDGTYTMELITVTPFGADRLHHVTFTVVREMIVRAQLVDYAEDP